MTRCTSPSASSAMVPFALAIMLGVSLLPPRTVRRIAFVVFAISFALLALTFVIGVEIKGARRWINLPGLSLQPSEFVKPSFAVRRRLAVRRAEGAARVSRQR